MYHFYKNSEKDLITQAKQQLARINPTYVHRIEHELNSNPNLVQRINHCSDYLIPFYDKYGCDDVDAISLKHDIHTFDIILSLKKAYNDRPLKDTDLNHALFIYLGYLLALVNTVYQHPRVPKTYSQADRNNIYAPFFCETYDPVLFDDQDSFRGWRDGFSGVQELLTINKKANGELTFNFRDETIVYYICVQHPMKLIGNRTDLIVNFISNYQEFHSNLAVK